MSSHLREGEVLDGRAAEGVEQSIRAQQRERECALRWEAGRDVHVNEIREDGKS